MAKEIVIEHKKEAKIVTAAVLIIIFLVFMFRGFSKEPELDTNEGGVEVRFGEPDEGGPDNSTITESEPYVPPTEASAEDVVSTDESDVSVKTSDTKKPETKETEENKEPVEKVDQAITDLMNKKKSSKDKSAGEGDGKKPGTQGHKDGDGDKKDGNPGEGGYKGFDKGLIEGYALYGRKIVAEPKLRDSYNSKGKVVVDILVNSKGQVVSANPGARGTTANDSKLLAIAKKLAYETKFNPLGSGKSQNGTITFKFGLK